jgi:hypothetical protein
MLAALALAGCGSSSSSPATPTLQPTVSANTTFRDNTERYSFSYPANWHIGSATTAQGIYVLPFAVPLSRAQVQLRVQRTRVSYGSLPEGKKIRSNGSTLLYHHASVSGRPAFEIDTHARGGESQVVTIVNGPRYTYTVSVSTPSPPLEPRTLFGYRRIVSTLKVF